MSPAYTPPSRAAISVKETTRLMIRLISYSRYFSTATPRQTGRAAVPRITTAPTTDWLPQPGISSATSWAMNTPMISETTKMAAPL